MFLTTPSGGHEESLVPILDVLEAYRGDQSLKVVFRDP